MVHYSFVGCDGSRERFGERRSPGHATFLQLSLPFLTCPSGFSYLTLRESVRRFRKNGQWRCCGGGGEEGESLPRWVYVGDKLKG